MDKKEIDRAIKVLIKDIKYEKEFEPLIYEYFYRYIEIFNLNKKELFEKLKNYINRVKKISYKSKVDWDGEIDFRKKNIYIKKEYSKNINKKDIYGILYFIDIVFHEQVHATDTNFKYSEMMDEYLTIIKTRILTGRNIYEDKLPIITKMEGYEVIQPLGSIMCASLGIYEKELGTVGLDYICKYYNKTFPNIDINVYLKIFSENLNIAYNSYNKQNFKNLEEAIISMYNFSIKLIDEKIIEYYKDKKDFNDKDFKEKIMFELYKIEKNLKLIENKYLGYDINRIKFPESIFILDKLELDENIIKKHQIEEEEIDNTELINKLYKNFNKVPEYKKVIYKVVRKIMCIFNKRKLLANSNNLVNLKRSTLTSTLPEKINFNSNIIDKSKKVEKGRNKKDDNYR